MTPNQAIRIPAPSPSTNEVAGCSPFALRILEEELGSPVMAIASGGENSSSFQVWLRGDDGNRHTYFSYNGEGKGICSRCGSSCFRSLYLFSLRECRLCHLNPLRLQDLCRTGHVLLRSVPNHFAIVGKERRRVQGDSEPAAGTTIPIFPIQAGWMSFLGRLFRKGRWPLPKTTKVSGFTPREKRKMSQQDSNCRLNSPRTQVPSVSGISLMDNQSSFR